MPFTPYTGDTVEDKSFKPYEGETIDDPNFQPPEEPSFLDKTKSFMGDVRDQVVDTGAMLINPAGKALEIANQIPGVKEVVPDFLAGTGPVAEGIAKGGYNAARNTAQLGADVTDFILPGDYTPMSDMLSVAPKAEYEGYIEPVVGNVTEVATGFVLGNKLGAMAKTAQLGDDAVKMAIKIAPKVSEKLIEIGASILKGGAQGVVGTGITTEPGSTNVMVGKDSLAEKIGIGSLMDGLPTDSLDSAKNALAARVNTALDGFITGAGLTTAFKGIGALYQVSVAKVVTDKMSPIWSDVAKIKVVFDQLRKEAAKITGSSDPKDLDAFMKRAEELARAGRENFDDVGTGAGRLQGDLGIQGVDKIDEGLDTATTMARGSDQSVLDEGISTMFEKQAKLAGQGGSETALKREVPTRALARALDQTQDALGGSQTAETGAKSLQNFGDAAVAEGKTQKTLAETEMTNILGTAHPTEKVLNPTKEPKSIIESVHHAADVRRAEVNDAYKAIPADVKYEGASIANIISSNRDAVPDDIVNLLGKDSDGSFNFLYRKVRPAIAADLKKLENSKVPLSREQTQTKNILRELKKNIDETQIDHVKSIGRSDVANAAEEAKKAYEKKIAENTQGVVGELGDIRAKHNLNVEDTYSDSRKALKKIIDEDVTEPESNKRLLDVLSSNEGGRNEELLAKYKGAKDKAKELENIEHEVYGNKLREFFDARAAKPGTRAPTGTKSFEDLLDDPQSGDRVKYMLDLADKEGDESVQKALEYMYARALHKKLFSGHLTEHGAEITTAPGVRSIQTNEGFLKNGERIFKNNPGYMKTTKDILELAHQIQRSSYTKAAPKSVAGMTAERAKQGLKTAIAPVFGPLSHKGYIIKTGFNALLDIVNPQVVVDRMLDRMLADGMEFSKAYNTLLDAGNKKGGKIETTAKVLFNSLLRTNGEREKFERAVKRRRAEAQTDEALGKSDTAGPKGKFEGQLEEGNIDLAKRPKVKNEDGSISTVRSVSYNIDGKEVLIPTVVNGKVVSDEEALQHYKKTGEHLGKFDTPENATAYSEALHKAQEEYYK